MSDGTSLALLCSAKEYNTNCCRKEDRFQGPVVGSCLTLGNELSQETRADEAGDFSGKGSRVESSRVREPRRTALLHGSRSRAFPGWLWLICLTRVLPDGDVCIIQPRWSPWEGFWEVERTYGLASPLL